MFTLKNILMLILRNALVSLAVVFISGAAIAYLANRISQMADTVGTNRNLQATLGKRIEISAILKNDAQIVGTNDLAIENAFVSSDNILGFVNSLDILAQVKSIVQVYHFDTPVASAIAAPFPVSTILYSTNQQTTLPIFSDYLKEFNKLPYFTKIDSLNIASQDKLGWVGASTITFGATLYTKTPQ